MIRHLVIFSIFVYSFISQAQIYNSAISAATGGAGRAAIDIGEPSFSNPATLLHLRGNHFLYSQGQEEFAAAVSDNNKDNICPAGLAYFHKNSDLDGTPAIKDVRLTLADRIGDSRWGFGVTVHQFRVDTTDDTYTEINADVGIIFTPTPDWGLALVS